MRASSDAESDKAFMRFLDVIYNISMIFFVIVAALLTIKLWYKKLKDFILSKYKKIFK